MDCKNCRLSRLQQKDAPELPEQKQARWEAEKKRAEARLARRMVKLFEYPPEIFNDYFECSHGAGRIL